MQPHMTREKWVLTTLSQLGNYTFQSLTQGLLTGCHPYASLRLVHEAKCFREFSLLWRCHAGSTGLPSGLLLAQPELA